MANVYSSLLWRANDLGPTLGEPDYSPVVPAGFIWVVRDILAWNRNFAGWDLQGFVLGDTQGGILWSLWLPDVTAARTYHQEMRQVLNPGDHISLNTADTGWYFRISGYQLSLP